MPKTMTPTLRPVNPARDADALAAIYAPFVLNTFISFEEVPPTPAEMQARAEAVLDKGLPYILDEILWWYSKEQQILGIGHARH